MIESSPFYTISRSKKNRFRDLPDAYLVSSLLVPMHTVSCHLLLDA